MLLYFVSIWNCKTLGISFKALLIPSSTKAEEYARDCGERAFFFFQKKGAVYWLVFKHPVATQSKISKAIQTLSCSYKKKSSTEGQSTSILLDTQRSVKANAWHSYTHLLNHSVPCSAITQGQAVLALVLFHSICTLQLSVWRISLPELLQIS